MFQTGVKVSQSSIMLLKLILVFVLMVSTVQGFLSPSPSYIPKSWTRICSKEISSVELQGSKPGFLPNNKRVSLIQLTCRIPHSDNVHWKLMDLRSWTMENNINSNTQPENRSVIYNISVTCGPGANISLPWPMRIVGLRELHVFSCQLVDKFTNYQDPLDSKISDELRVLEIRDSTWLMDLTISVIGSSSDGALNLTSDYDCGQDSSLEILIMSNVTDKSEQVNFEEFNLTSLDPTGDLNNSSLGLSDLPFLNQPVKPEDPLIKDAEKAISDQQSLNTDSNQEDVQTLMGRPNHPTESQEAENGFLDWLKKSFETQTKCNYEKLKLIDESVAPISSLFHFEFMVQGARYPVLEVMNYSRFGLVNLARELSEWRRYFPRLEYLDLTYNAISQVKVRGFPPKPGTGTVTFDLRHNNITQLTMEMLRSWARVDKFHVDIRENPIHCDCDMSNFLQQIKNRSVFTGAMAQYDYVQYLTCSTPASLVGHQLHSLSHSSLPCPDHESDTAALIALGVIMGVLMVLILVIIRFKVEIRILLYTRLHLRLPCDADALRTYKNYDAFVSYCNDDAPWVYENLVKFLENSQRKLSINTNGSNQYISGDRTNDDKHFRLCIHERDFVPGKTIFDNIVDSIEASRHTIIVLSPSFMKSHWAMEELRQAYRQSLVEKTRHLIVLLLEKVPKDQMDPLISRCCKTFTYLDVADSLFKDRLIFSLSTKDRSAKRRDRLAAKQQPIPPSRIQLEVGELDNVVFTNYSGRPREPVRELSNTSTSSTTALMSH